MDSEHNDLFIHKNTNIENIVIDLNSKVNSIISNED